METRPSDAHRGPGPALSPLLPRQATARAAPVPWFPRWAREFADQFFAGTTCVFMLHGNVHDLIRQESASRHPTAASPNSWPPSSSATGTSFSCTT